MRRQRDCFSIRFNTYCKWKHAIESNQNWLLINLPRSDKWCATRRSWRHELRNSSPNSRRSHRVSNGHSKIDIKCQELQHIGISQYANHVHHCVSRTRLCPSHSFEIYGSNPRRVGTSQHCSESFFNKINIIKLLCRPPGTPWYWYPRYRKIV